MSNSPDSPCDTPLSRPQTPSSLPFEKEDSLPSLLLQEVSCFASSPSPSPASSLTKQELGSRVRSDERDVQAADSDSESSTFEDGVNDSTPRTGGAGTDSYAAILEKLSKAEDVLKKAGKVVLEESSRKDRVREEDGAFSFEWAELRQALETFQRRCEDRSQYLPVMEVRRMHEDFRDTQQSLLSCIISSLDALLDIGEEGKTRLPVKRSAMRSVVANLERRVECVERSLECVVCKLDEIDGLEREVGEFLRLLLAENEELWRLQEKSALTEQRPVHPGDVVPTEKYLYLRWKTGVLAERLRKTQQLLDMHQTLATRLEDETRELLRENNSLIAKLDREQQVVQERTVALSKANQSLQDAVRQIENLQAELLSERRSRERAVEQFNGTYTSMKVDHERRLDQLRRASEEAEAGLRKDFQSLTDEADSRNNTLMLRVRELEDDLSHERSQNAGQLREFEAASRRVCQLSAELEGLRSEEIARTCQHQAAQTTFEKDRESLQKELDGLHTQCAEMATQLQSEKLLVPDREQLLLENLRLREQRQCVQEENASLREELRAALVKREAFAELSRELAGLRPRLREFAKLRDATKTARAEARSAAEETTALCRARDELAARLNRLFESAKAPTRVDEASDNATKRRHHVFRHTSHVAAGKGTGEAPQVRSEPSLHLADSTRALWPRVGDETPPRGHDRPYVERSA
ncbi:unnamed protein product [Phytomonas sp. Hart1]|nr:unnamed protein product [Phytomonas sp. Hart1]|eukprot:CCW69593.1 unnamed protein product [Phytomonas sp. isolate Hart1]